MAAPTWDAAAQILYLHGDTTLEEIDGVINDAAHCVKVQYGDIASYNISTARIICDTSTTITVSKKEYVNFACITIGDRDTPGELTVLVNQTLTVIADEYLKNAVFTFPRISTNQWRQADGAVQNGGTLIMRNVKLYTASPFNAFNGTDMQLVQCELYPLDRSSDPVPSQAQIRTNTITDVTNSILALSGNIYKAIAKTTGFVLRNIGLGKPFLALHAYNRGGTFEEFNFIGFDIDGDGYLLMAASARAFLQDTPLGTSLNLNWQFQQLCGIMRIAQQVQFTVLDALTQQPIPHARISTVDTDDGIRPTSGWYADQFSYQGISTLVEYIGSLDEDKRYTARGSVLGIRTIFNMLTGAFWYNDHNMPNGNPNLEVGQKDSKRTEDPMTDRHPWYTRAYGYTLIAKQVIMRSDGIVKQETVNMLPDLTVTKTYAEVAAMTHIETYDDLYDAMRYYIVENDDIGFLARYKSDPIAADGNTLTLAPGYSIVTVAEDNANPVQCDIADGKFTIYLGAQGVLQKGTKITAAVINGALTLGAGTSVRGNMSYTVNGIMYKNYNVKPELKTAHDESYTFRIMEVAVDESMIQKYLKTTSNGIDDWIFLDKDQKYRIIIEGHVVEYSETYAADTMPEYLDPVITPYQYPEYASVWKQKLDDGVWDITQAGLDSNGAVMTVTFADQVEFEDLNSHLLNFLVRRFIRAYNIVNGTYVRASDYITDDINTITLKKVNLVFTKLRFTTGTHIKLILRNEQDAKLSHNFGDSINVQTADKYAGLFVDHQAGDVLGVEINGVLQPLETLQNADALVKVYNKVDTVDVKVKRYKMDSLAKTLTADDSTYAAFFISKNLPDDLPVNPWVPITDRLSIVAGKLVYSDDLSGQNASPAQDNAKEIAAYADFDLSYPNGVKGNHVINRVEDNTIVMNYEPAVSPADTFRYVSMPVMYVSGDDTPRALGYVSFQAQPAILVNVETPANVTAAIHELNEKIDEQLVIVANIEHISETSLRMLASESVGRRALIDNLEFLHNEVPTNFTASGRTLGVYVEIEPDDQHLVFVLPLRKEEINDPDATFGTGKLRTKLVRLPDDFDPLNNVYPFEPGAVILERPPRDIDTLPFTDDQDKMIVEAFNVLNISGKFVACVEADDTVTAGVDGINTVLHPGADKGIFVFNFGGNGLYNATATMRVQALAVDHRGITEILDALTANKEATLEVKDIVSVIKVISEKFKFDGELNVNAALSDLERDEVANKVWNMSITATAAFSANSVINSIRQMDAVLLGSTVRNKDDSTLKHMDRFVANMISVTFDLKDKDGNDAGTDAVYEADRV